MKIVDFIKDNIENENLFIDLIPVLMSGLDGSIMEIGAGIGETTISFLKISKSLDRKTIVIDPFESEWEKIPDSYGKPYPYEIFYNNTKEYLNNLILIKKPSHEVSVYDIKNLNLKVSYSFIDGLQDVNSLLNDLKLCEDLEVDLIVMDDFERNTELSRVPESVNIFSQNNKTYTIIPQSHAFRCKVFLINKKIIDYDFQI